jgi:hypothetical protein
MAALGVRHGLDVPCRAVHEHVVAASILPRDRAIAQTHAPCARRRSCLWAIPDALLKDMSAQDA